MMTEGTVDNPDGQPLSPVIWLDSLQPPLIDGVSRPRRPCQRLVDRALGWSIDQTRCQSVDTRFLQHHQPGAVFLDVLVRLYPGKQISVRGQPDLNAGWDRYDGHNHLLSPSLTGIEPHHRHSRLSFAG